MQKTFELTKSFTLLLAISTGIAVANLYYIQPLESMIAAEFGVSHSQIGFASMLSQAGYAIGLFFLVPLGDLLERRKLITQMLGLVLAALLAAAVSPNYPFFAVSMLAVGITSIVPQLIIPYAAQLAKPEERGGVIGTVMSGLLIGILLSRTFSGLVGSVWGWRPVYFCAMVFIAGLLWMIRSLFPESLPTSSASYPQLIKSIPGIIKHQKTVRDAAVNGFFMFGAFSAFWSSLIFLLESDAYHMGSREEGFIGLFGVVGALAAPLIGKLSDKKNPKFTVGIGTILSFLSYLLFYAIGQQMMGLILAVIVLDLGNQGAQVSNQARIQALGDEVRSRNNTIYMTSYFIGGSLGSFLGALGWQHFGWAGVCSVGLIFLTCALIANFILFKKNK